MKRDNIITLISALFILLFVYAAMSKLLDYQQFRVQLGQSPLLTSMASFVAWFIPVVELAIALLLVFRRTRQIGLYACFSLMTLFTGYIIAITRFSEHVPCSCGGILEKMSWDQHLVFNIIFVALAIVSILTDRPSKSTYFVATNQG